MTRADLEALAGRLDNAVLRAERNGNLTVRLSRPTCRTLSKFLRAHAKEASDAE